MDFAYTHNPRTFKLVFIPTSDRLEKVKSLPGRKYQPKLRAWYVPINDYSVSKLKEWGFSFDDVFYELQKKKEIKPLEEFNTEAQLRGYQEDGIQFFHQHKGNVLLADEQGLGKTVQVISYVNSVEKFPCLVICPASLKLNWKNEIRKWTASRDVYICSGREPKLPANVIKKYKWVICNYDIVAGHSQDVIKNDPVKTAELRNQPSWFSTFMKANFQMIVLDESQNIKNEENKRTKAIMELASWIPSRACLSGTPISNRPMEFFTTISLIDPTLFVNKWDFGRRFCNPTMNFGHLQFNGASHMKELHEILTKTMMLRRLKSDVLSDLPDKQKIVIPIQMDEKIQKEYETAEMSFKQYLKSNFGEGEKVTAEKRAAALVKIEMLRQLAARGKMNMTINWIANFLDTGKKLVVFAWHQEIIDTLMKEFKGIAVKIDGSVPANKRQEAVDRFQTNDEIRLFIGNIKAAGTGITLTAASDTCTVELSWSPSDLVQAEDRVHRIGQKNAVCNYYLMSEGTIDEKMMKLIDEKQQIISNAMDGVDSDKESMLSELMRNYQEN